MDVTRHALWYPVKGARSRFLSSILNKLYQQTLQRKIHFLKLRKTYEIYSANPYKSGKRNKEQRMKQRTRTKYMIFAIPVFAFIMLIVFSTVYGQTKEGKQQTAPTKSLPLLIDIGAKQCIPCKMMAPILEDLQKNYSDSVKVEFIDVWENRSAAQKYGIRAIPTQIFYNASGKELYRHMGFMSKEQIIGVFRELGIEVKKNQGKKK